MNDFTNGPAGRAAGTALGMETMREFRVETMRTARSSVELGGQFNVVHKAGSNDLHGIVCFTICETTISMPGIF